MFLRGFWFSFVISSLFGVTKWFGCISEAAETYWWDSDADKGFIEECEFEKLDSEKPSEL